MIGTGGENKVALVSIGREIWLSIKDTADSLQLAVQILGGVLLASRKATSDRQLNLSATFQDYDRRDNRSKNQHNRRML